MVAQRLANGMAARGSAPAVPRLSLLVNPQVHPSADVHEFSFIEGDVQLGAGVMVAPGTAITAESGASVMVGEGCSLLPGVVVEGLAGTQVSSGPGGGACSVWLGDRTVVAHKAIIHSPSFIGEGCFVGFRSTVFNARLGKGCVVMMHALVQDVELPPGKCVPSGSVITTQHQADQLPEARPEDFEFAREVTGVARTAGSAAGSASRHVSRNARGPSSNAAASAKRSRAKARLVPVSGRSASPSNSQFYSRSSSSGQNAGLGASGQGSFSQATTRQAAASQASVNHSTVHHSSYATEGANMQATRSQSQRLAPEVVQQVRQYLSQGYRVGMEHADARRYRSGVWETCTPIKETREQAVFEGLERCLAEHAGEYVRIFGINTQMKCRVGMTTVQRPDGQPVSIDTRSVPASSNNGGGYAQASNGAASASTGGLTAEVAQQVRNLLRSGFIIGTEHADARRYRSNVWKSCSPIKSTNEQEVLSHLDHCLAEHSGEYVRMFGIDTQAKRRMASVTIQRADGKPVNVSPTNTPAASGSASSQGGGYSQSYGQSNAGGGSSAAAQAVGQILAQGNTVGVEMADARRYRSGIWQTAPSVQSASQLQAVLAQNADKYVRIFGVNKAMKTRGAATTVQKPGQKVEASAKGGAQGSRDPINANPPHYDDPAFLKNNGNGGGGNGAVDADVMNQITQLVNQGCRISIEFADKRRYRSGIWKTGPAIESRRPADAISALSQQLAQHQGDYVRLIGVDPQAKRRVLEATIQRP
ncbi:MAG: ribulose bisphosphate carboxylase small subunit [Cyanobacteria bacterium J06598_3]